MANPLEDLIRSTMQAVERRDVSEAAARGVTVDELRVQRERWHDELREAELRGSREERIAPHRHLVTDEDYRRIVLDEVDSDAWRIVSRWLTSPAAFLVLGGEKGTGKTVASLAALSRFGGRVFSALDMVRAWKNETDEAQALRPAILGCAFLVLDDLGTEPDPSHARVGFHELVNGRQGNRRTIITTNLPRSEIERRYDPRTIERLDHSGAWVALKSTSMRRRPA